MFPYAIDSRCISYRGLRRSAHVLSWYKSRIARYHTISLTDNPTTFLARSSFEATVWPHVNDGFFNRKHVRSQHSRMGLMQGASLQDKGFDRSRGQVYINIVSCIILIGQKLIQIKLKVGHAGSGGYGEQAYKTRRIC